MKEPKTFKYPRMYYCAALKGHTSVTTPRIRIIYPNGKSEWFTLNNTHTRGFKRPCWADFQNFSNGFEALKAMRKFDQHMRVLYRSVHSSKWRHAVFIGEIK